MSWVWRPLILSLSPFLSLSLSLHQPCAYLFSSSFLLPHVAPQVQLRAYVGLAFFLVLGMMRSMRYWGQAREGADFCFFYALVGELGSYEYLVIKTLSEIIFLPTAFFMGLFFFSFCPCASFRALYI